MGGGILMSDTLDLQLASLLLAFILIFTLIFEKFTFSLEHFFAEQEHFLECEPNVVPRRGTPGLRRACGGQDDRQGVPRAHDPGAQRFPHTPAASRQPPPRV